MCYLYDDDQEDILTPNHLLYGRNLKFINYRESYEINVNLSDGYFSKRMQYINRVIKHFWNRWRKDYVLALRDNLRYKKNSCVTAPAVNDVVLIHDDKQHRQQWNLGKITELFQGMDGQIRTAKIKLRKSRNIIHRPINRLYPIEIQINDDTDM